MPHNRNLGIPDNSEVIIERSNPLRPYDFCCIEAVGRNKQAVVTILNCPRRQALPLWP